MSKLMVRLEKLKEFAKRDQELKARAMVIEHEARMLGEEFRKYMTTELGLPEDQQLHLSQILTNVMESSIEPAVG